jgi:hypothetical protein
MKNCSLLLLLSALFAFASCSKENPPLQETLVGKWNITSMVDVLAAEELIVNSATQTTTADISFTDYSKSTLNLNEVRTDGDGGLEAYIGTFSWLNDSEIQIKYTFSEGSEIENVELKGKPYITDDKLQITLVGLVEGEDKKFELKADREE